MKPRIAKKILTGVSSLCKNGEKVGQAKLALQHAGVGRFILYDWVTKEQMEEWGIWYSPFLLESSLNKKLKNLKEMV